MAKNHYYLSEVGVGVRFSHPGVVVVELSQQVGEAESYLVFQSSVIQVSFLEQGLKMPYVLLEVVVGVNLHSYLQVEVVRMRCGVLEVEARVQYGLRQEPEAGGLRLKIGLVEDHRDPQGFVEMELLLEV